jgi:hypothetical protein
MSSRVRCNLDELPQISVGHPERPCPAIQESLGLFCFLMKFFRHRCHENQYPLLCLGKFGQRTAHYRLRMLVEQCKAQHVALVNNGEVVSRAMSQGLAKFWCPPPLPANVGVFLKRKEAYEDGSHLFEFQSIGSPPTDENSFGCRRRPWMRAWPGRDFLLTTAP